MGKVELRKDILSLPKLSAMVQNQMLAPAEATAHPVT